MQHQHQHQVSRKCYDLRKHPHRSCRAWARKLDEALLLVLLVLGAAAAAAVTDYDHCSTMVSPTHHVHCAYKLRACVCVSVLFHSILIFMQAKLTKVTKQTNACRRIWNCRTLNSRRMLDRGNSHLFVCTRVSILQHWMCIVRLVQTSRQQHFRFPCFHPCWILKYMCVFICVGILFVCSFIHSFVACDLFICSFVWVVGVVRTLLLKNRKEDFPALIWYTHKDARIKSIQKKF